MTSEVISIVYVFLVIFYFVWKGIFLHTQSKFNLLSYQSSQKQWRQINSSFTSWKMTSNNAWYIVPSARRMPRRGIPGFTSGPLPFSLWTWVKGHCRCNAPHPCTIHTFIYIKSHNREKSIFKWYEILEVICI